MLTQENLDQIQHRAEGMASGYNTGDASRHYAKDVLALLSDMKATHDDWQSAMDDKDEMVLERDRRIVELEHHVRTYQADSITLDVMVKERDARIAELEQAILAMEGPLAEVMADAVVTTFGGCEVKVKEQPSTPY